MESMTSSTSYSGRESTTVLWSLMILLSWYYCMVVHLTVRKPSWQR